MRKYLTRSLLVGLGFGFLLMLNIIGVIYVQNDKQALNFDESNDYASINDNTSLTGTTVTSDVGLFF